jgi:hypothetical protein
MCCVLAFSLYVLKLPGQPAHENAPRGGCDHLIVSEARDAHSTPLYKQRLENAIRRLCGLFCLLVTCFNLPA